jgi:hypothetical protein
MSETVAKASAALQDWPAWNAIFLVVVAMAGIYMRYLGRKDQKSGIGGVEVPMYLIAHDVAKAVGVIEEEARKQTTFLAEIAKTNAAINHSQVRTHQLIEDLRNVSELHPREK